MRELSQLTLKVAVTKKSTLDLANQSNSSITQLKTLEIIKDSINKKLKPTSTRNTCTATKRTKVVPKSTKQGQIESSKQKQTSTIKQPSKEKTVTQMSQPPAPTYLIPTPTNV